MRKPSRDGAREVVLQRVGGSEADAVDQDMELAVALFELGEDAVDIGVGGDVALEGWAPRKVGDQVLGVGAEAFILIADGEVDSGGVKLLGDGPGDAAFVGEAEDDGGAAFQIEHGLTPSKSGVKALFPIQRRLHRSQPGRAEKPGRFANLVHPSCAPARLTIARTISISASEVDELDVADRLAEEAGAELAKFCHRVGGEEAGSWRKQMVGGSVSDRCQRGSCRSTSAGSGFGGVDDVRRLAGPKSGDGGFDDLAEQRVVSAAEHDRVGVESGFGSLLMQFREIDSDDFGGDGMVDPALFDQRDQQGAGLFETAKAVAAWQALRRRGFGRWPRWRSPARRASRLLRLRRRRRAR